MFGLVDHAEASRLADVPDIPPLEGGHGIRLSASRAPGHDDPLGQIHLEGQVESLAMMRPDRTSMLSWSGEVRKAGTAALR